MTKTTLRLAFLKQREINRRLTEQLRAQTMLCTALASVKFDKTKQPPAVLQRIRDAHAIMQSLDAGQTPATQYPTRKVA